MNSIQKRLLISILSVTTIFLLIVGGLNYWWAKDMVINLSEQRANTMANEVVGQIESYLTKKGQYAWVLSQDEQVRVFVENLETRDQDVSKDVNYQHILKTFTRIVANDTDINEVYIAIEKTQRIYTTQEFENPPDYMVSTRPWYQAAITKNDIAYTSPYICPATGKYVITASAPFYNQKGELLGVAAVDIFAAKMQNIVNSLRILDSGNAFMIDDNGIVISHPDSSMINKSLLDSEFSSTINNVAERMLNNETGMEKTEFNSTERYIFYKPLPEIGWSVGIMLPSKEVLEPVVNMGKIFVLTITVGTILALLLITWITNHIVKPVEEFTDLMTEVSNGDYTKRANIITDDEVGRLGESLNKMLDQQEKLIGQITSSSYQIGISGHELSITIGEIKVMLPLIISHLRSFTQNFASEYYDKNLSSLIESLQRLINKMVLISHDSRIVTSNINNITQLNENGEVLSDQENWLKINNYLLQSPKLLEELEIELADIVFQLKEIKQLLNNNINTLQPVHNQIDQIHSIHADSLDNAEASSLELMTLSRELMKLASVFKVGSNKT